MAIHLQPSEWDHVISKDGTIHVDKLPRTFNGRIFNEYIPANLVSALLDQSDVSPIDKDRLRGFILPAIQAGGAMSVTLKPARTNALKDHPDIGRVYPSADLHASGIGHQQSAAARERVRTATKQCKDRDEPFKAVFAGLLSMPRDLRTSIAHATAQIGLDFSKCYPSILSGFARLMGFSTPWLDGIAAGDSVFYDRVCERFPGVQRDHAKQMVNGMINCQGFKGWVKGLAKDRVSGTERFTCEGFVEYHALLAEVTHVRVAVLQRNPAIARLFSDEGSPSSVKEPTAITFLLQTVEKLAMWDVYVWLVHHGYVAEGWFSYIYDGCLFPPLQPFTRDALDELNAYLQQHCPFRLQLKLETFETLPEGTPVLVDEYGQFQRDWSVGDVPSAEGSNEAEARDPSMCYAEDGTLIGDAAIYDNPEYKKHLRAFTHGAHAWYYVEEHDIYVRVEAYQCTTTYPLPDGSMEKRVTPSRKVWQKTPSQLRDTYRDIKFTYHNGKKNVCAPFVGYFLSDPRRMKFRTVFSRPRQMGPDAPGVLNLWEDPVWHDCYDDGSAYPVDHELIRRIRQHLVDLLGEKKAVWFEGWMACRLKHPHIIDTHSVNLIGNEGSGKSTIAEILRALVGQTKFVTTGNVDDVMGKFNATLSGKYFVVLEELQQRHVDSEAFKDFCTRETILVNEKNEKRVQEQRVYAVLCIGNRVNLTGVTGRRLVLFNCRDTHRGASTYFRALRNAIADPRALKGYYKYLMELDYTADTPYRPEEEFLTAEADELRAFSRPHLEDFVDHLITSGAWGKRFNLVPALGGDSIRPFFTYDSHSAWADYRRWVENEQLEANTFKERKPFSLEFFMRTLRPIRDGVKKSNGNCNYTLRVDAVQEWTSTHLQHRHVSRFDAKLGHHKVVLEPIEGENGDA
jgi:hypothetical protein